MLIPENLDQESFEEILQKALKQVPLLSSQWTNLNPSDPGVMLLELFSWYKEVQQYHLNVIGREHGLAYLKLLGASPRPVQPARTCLALTGWGKVPAGSVFYADQIPFETMQPVTVAKAQPTLLGRGDGPVVDCRNFLRSQGRMEFSPFGTEENPKSSFVLYFDQPLPAGEPLGLYLQLKTTEHRSVDYTSFQSYVAFHGEYFDGAGYHPFAVLQDGTQGFFHSGLLSFQLPADALHQKNSQGYPVHFVVDRGSYVVAPVITALWFNAVEGIQKKTGCRIQRCVRSQEGGYPFVPDALYLSGNTRVYGVEGEKRIPLPWREGSGGVLEVLSGSPEEVELVSWDDSMGDYQHLGEAYGLGEFTLDLQRKDLEADSLVLYVKESDGCWYRWRQVEDFYDSHPDSRHYRFDSREGILQFGDGEHGMAPEGELALMSWAVCQGALGNIQPGELQNPNSHLSVRLRNILPAWGGQDVETVEECYRRVEREFKQPCRCVTLADFEEAVRSTPGVPVKRVRAFLRKEAPNQVFVALETYGDNHTLNPGCLDNLRRAVLSRVMVGTKVNFLPPSYVELKVYAEISLKPQQSDKRQMVYQAFSDYFEDEKIGFGAVLRKNDLLDYLYTLPCVSRVEALDLSFSGSNAVLRNGDVFLQDHCLPAVGSLNITIRTDES